MVWTFSVYQLEEVGFLGMIALVTQQFRAFSFKFENILVPQIRTFCVVSIPMQSVCCVDTISTNFNQNGIEYISD